MKSTEIKRKTPLARKSAKPRRTHPERVSHQRMKRKAVSMTAQEERHLDRLAKMPCAVTGRRVGNDGRSCVTHHLMKAPGKRCRRDHRWTVRLLDELHRNHSRISVHGLGTEAKFEAHHGLAPGYLIAWAQREWEITKKEEGKP